MKNSGKCPYGDLYIYYLEGVPPNEMEQEFGGTFIGNWVEDGFSFLFFTEPVTPRFLDVLEKSPDIRLIDSYSMPYDQWQQDADRVLEIEPFSISAPWVDSPPRPGWVSLNLDPGVVFGTGGHPTTGDCLRALVELNKFAEPQKVLDLGTGTGLLALAAAALGSKQIIAVDLNPLAAKTAENNVRLNRMESRIKVVCGSALDFSEEPADLVVANIHFEVMKKLLEKPGFIETRPFILSGLLRSEIRETAHMLNKLGGGIFKQWERDNTWFTVLGAGRGFSDC